MDYPHSAFFGLLFFNDPDCLFVLKQMVMELMFFAWCIPRTLSLESQVDSPLVPLHVPTYCICVHIQSVFKIFWCCKGMSYRKFSPPIWSPPGADIDAKAARQEPSDFVVITGDLCLAVYTLEALLLFCCLAFHAFENACLRVVNFHAIGWYEDKCRARVLVYW